MRRLSFYWESMPISSIWFRTFCNSSSTERTGIHEEVVSLAGHGVGMGMIWSRARNIERGREGEGCSEKEREGERERKRERGGTGLQDVTLGTVSKNRSFN
jgi:hypothetical protein